MALPLVALPATELRRLIGIKAISPVELLEACIDRIEAIDPAVNAIAARAFDRARREARAAEAAVLNGDVLGRLHGLPIGIKDLQDTEGLLTTHGSPLYRHHRSAGRRFRCSVRWLATSPMCACCSQRNSASTAATRCRMRSIRSRRRIRGSLISDA